MVKKLADKVVAGSRAKKEAQTKLNEAKQLVEEAIGTCKLINYKGLMP